MNEPNDCDRDRQKRSESVFPNFLGQLAGIKVFVDPHLQDRIQFRFPRSKKKRIRKKWAKQERNYKRIPSKSIYKIGDAIYVHPILYEQLKKTLERENERLKNGH